MSKLNPNPQSLDGPVGDSPKPVLVIDAASDEQGSEPSRGTKRRRLSEESPQADDSSLGDELDDDAKRQSILAAHIEELENDNADQDDGPIWEEGVDDNPDVEMSEDGDEAQPEADQGTNNVPLGVHLAELASDADHGVDDGISSTHPRYTMFLADLCSRTHTTSVQPFVLEGLATITVCLQSLHLDTDHSSQQHTEGYALAFVIWVWMAACFKAQMGRMPPHSNGLSMTMGAYLLSAHAVTRVWVDQLALPRLEAGVRYWEQRSKVMKLPAWTNQPWIERIPLPDLQAHQKRNEVAEDYLQALERKGKGGLCIEIMEKDRPISGQRSLMSKYVGEGGSMEHWMYEETIDLLASINTDLLKSLIDGSFSRTAEISLPANRVQREILKLHNRSPPAPAIYINIICDRAGNPPAPRHMRKVLECMQQYVQGGPDSDSLAATIDQLIAPLDSWPTELAKRGLRRYTEFSNFQKKKDHYSPSATRRQVVKNFVSAVHARIQREAQLHREYVPFRTPIVEIGFSVDPHRRLQQHRRHRSSNYLMNLAEACFRHLYPGRFRLQQSIICACFRNVHPWLGEIILTQLAQGYADTGEGFSHHIAGGSNRGAYSTLNHQAWLRLEREAEKSGEFISELEKLDAEIERNLQSSLEAEAQMEADYQKEIDFYNAARETMDLLSAYIDALVLQAESEE